MIASCLSDDPHTTTRTRRASSLSSSSMHSSDGGTLGQQQRQATTSSIFTFPPLFASTGQQPSSQQSSSSSTVVGGGAQGSQAASDLVLSQLALLEDRYAMLCFTTPASGPPPTLPVPVISNNNSSAFFSTSGSGSGSSSSLRAAKHATSTDRTVTLAESYIALAASVSSSKSGSSEEEDHGSIAYFAMLRAELIHVYHNLCRAEIISWETIAMTLDDMLARVSATLSSESPHLAEILSREITILKSIVLSEIAMSHHYDFKDATLHLHVARSLLREWCRAHSSTIKHVPVLFAPGTPKMISRRLESSGSSIDLPGAIMVDSLSSGMSVAGEVVGGGGSSKVGRLGEVGTSKVGRLVDSPTLGPSTGFASTTHHHNHLFTWLNMMASSVWNKIGTVFRPVLSAVSSLGEPTGSTGSDGVTEVYTITSKFIATHRCSSVSLIYLVSDEHPFFPTGFTCSGRAAYEKPRGLNSYPAVFSLPDGGRPTDHWPNVISLLHSTPVVLAPMELEHPPPTSPPHGSQRRNSVSSNASSSTGSIHRHSTAAQSERTNAAADGTSQKSSSARQRASSIASNSSTATATTTAASAAAFYNTDTEDDNLSTTSRQHHRGVRSSSSSTTGVVSGLVGKFMIGMFGRRLDSESVAGGGRRRASSAQSSESKNPRRPRKRAVQFYDAKVDTTYILSRVDSALVAVVMFRGRRGHPAAAEDPADSDPHAGRSRGGGGGRGDGWMAVDPPTLEFLDRMAALLSHWDKRQLLSA